MRRPGLLLSGNQVNDLLPWRIDIDPFHTAFSQVNWNTVNLTATAVYSGFLLSSGAQNDLVDYRPVLGRGAWTGEVMYAKNTDGGITSVQLGGVEQGTVDSYAASSAQNFRTSVSLPGALGGMQTLTLKQATKNASSSSYYGRLQRVTLRRTS